jgi:hypothetical protein
MYDRLEQLEAALTSWIVVILAHNLAAVEPVIVNFWFRNYIYYRSEIAKLKTEV